MEYIVCAFEERKEIGHVDFSKDRLVPSMDV